MAGEWIKVRTNLWDDPRVSQLCDLTGVPESSVIGGLYWLWAAADEHTETGLMTGLSVSAVDRKTGIKGFGAALVAIAWVQEVPEGLQIIRFGEHNGESAKSRAQTAKRVANHKANAKVTPPALPELDFGVTDALPREDKRRTKTKPKPTSSSGDDGAPLKPFDRFWQAYPRRVGKNAAQRAWAKIKPDAATVDLILAAITAQQAGADWMRDDGEFIPHPATWLNGGRWLDEVRAYVEPAPKHGAWWASKESMEAFALTLTPPLKPNSGEYKQDFAARINAALENAGKPIEMPRPTAYTPPPARGGESSLTSEQLAARRSEMLAAAGSRKTAAPGGTA